MAEADEIRSSEIDQENLDQSEDLDRALAVEATPPVAVESVPAPSAPEEAIRGRIVAGMPLSVAAQKRIAARFQEIVGKKVRLSYRLDKKQLAGIRVELNGYSYDGTLRGQLYDLQKMLTRPDEEEP